LGKSGGVREERERRYFEVFREEDYFSNEIVKGKGFLTDLNGNGVRLNVLDFAVLKKGTEQEFESFHFSFVFFFPSRIEEELTIGSTYRTTAVRFSFA
jgi:hypothetical protein